MGCIHLDSDCQTLAGSKKLASRCNAGKCDLCGPRVCITDTDCCSSAHGEGQKCAKLAGYNDKRCWKSRCMGVFSVPYFAQKCKSWLYEKCPTICGFSGEKCGIDKLLRSGDRKLWYTWCYRKQDWATKSCFFSLLRDHEFPDLWPFDVSESNLSPSDKNSFQVCACEGNVSSRRQFFS